MGPDLIHLVKRKKNVVILHLKSSSMYIITSQKL